MTAARTVAELHALRKRCKELERALTMIACADRPRAQMVGIARRALADSSPSSSRGDSQLGPPTMGDHEDEARREQAYGTAAQGVAHVTGDSMETSPAKTPWLKVDGDESSHYCLGPDCPDCSPASELKEDS